MVEEVPFPTFDTSIVGTGNENVFCKHYVTAGTWTEVDDQKLINTNEYNDPALGLVAIPSNRWAVNWIYLVNNSPSELAVVVGQEVFTSQAAAEASTPPSSLPTLLEPQDGLGSLLGFVVFQQGDSSLTNILSTLGISFISTSATTHNALAGLQGGAADEYFHFTTAEHAAHTGGAASDADAYHTHATKVTGPGVVPDNAVARFDGTTGYLIQNSGATIDDLGNIAANNLSGTNTGDEVQATETVAGILEVATLAEVNTATSDLVAITPLKLGKAQANGVASLDGSGKVPASQIPAVALPEVHVVLDAAARLALTVQEGDEAIQTDDGSHWIYDGATWYQRPYPTDPVSGPASATDNALARFDGTTGKVIQNSLALLDDAGNLSATNLTGTNTGDEVQATETVAGIGEVATVAEVTTATSDLTFITPLKLGKAQASGVAPLDASSLLPVANLTSHASLHENSGAQEINVAGLNGLLADSQKVSLQEEGTPVLSSTTLNFVGTSVTVTDVGGVATITITGGGGGAPDPHASTHVLGGSDPIDADTLEIDYVPDFYTRSTDPAIVTNVKHLTAHLAGLNEKVNFIARNNLKVFVEAPTPAIDAPISMYLMNEATSGPATQINDSATSPLHLTVRQDTGRPVYTQDGSNTGLDWDTAGIDAGPGVTYSGTKIETALYNNQTWTMGIVVDVDAVVTDTRLVSINAFNGDWFTLFMNDLSKLYLNVNYQTEGEWNIDFSTGGRKVIYVVWDSAAGTEDDRLKLYLDGVFQARVGSGYVDQYSTVATNPDPVNYEFAIGRRGDNGGLSPNGRIFYWDLYDVALTSAQVGELSTALATDDDSSPIPDPSTDSKTVFQTGGRNLANNTSTSTNSTATYQAYLTAEITLDEESDVDVTATLQHRFDNTATNYQIQVSQTGTGTYWLETGSPARVDTTHRSTFNLNKTVRLAAGTHEFIVNFRSQTGTGTMTIYEGQLKLQQVYV
jgi:hypothetical protein